MMGTVRYRWCPLGACWCVVLLAVGSASPAGQDQVLTVSNWTGTTCSTGADVWVDGDLAYYGHFGVPCVDILDFSDPANPVYLSSFEPPPPDNAASAQDVKGENGLMIVAYEGDGNNGAGIVDVRDPMNPVQLTTVRVVADGTTFSDTHNLFYHEGYLYLARSRTPATVAIVDLTDYDPDNPPATITTAKWHVTDVGGPFVHDITVQGDRMYVSAWLQIVVYDISNIETQAPRRLGAHDGLSVHSSWATDDGRFLVVGEERSEGPIKLFEVQPFLNGVTLTLLDEIREGPQTFSPHNPLIVGNRVYTAWYESGLIVHRINAEAGVLEELGRLDPGTTWGAYPLHGIDRIVTGGFDHFTIMDATMCGLADNDPNGDNRVNLSDFAAFQRCQGAADGGIGDPACVPTFDTSCNGQIGADDMPGFVVDLTGP